MRSSSPLAPLVCCLGLAIATISAQTPPTDFETAPTFKASEILQLAYLSGMYHKVREEVTTHLGVNRFVIDSQFGTYIVQGNHLLQERVKEIYALARLRDMSNSQQYAEGVKQAAMAPLEAADNLINDPGETLTSATQGVGKFLGRIGKSASAVASGQKRDKQDDSTTKRATGAASAKRELCAELDVNPYSTNELLQQELERVAWVIAAGKMTGKIALMAVGGGAGTAISGLSTLDTTSRMVYDLSPADLRHSNLARLRAMGISERDAAAFLANHFFTPWHQTRIIDALDKMPGVKGRDVMLRDATEMTENATDAVFYEQTARLIAHAHTHGILVDRIVLMNGFPVCVGADGGVIVALHWDYAMWTARSERFATALQSMDLSGAKPSSVIVVLTGVMSPRLRQELEARAFRVQDKLLKGPLN